MLAAILGRSTEPALAFGNDADMMAEPGVGIDPEVMVEDMSSDVLEYSKGRFATLREAIARLQQKIPADGRSYEALVSGFRALMKKFSDTAAAVSRYIGGVHSDHSRVEPDGPNPPFVPVTAQRQRQALALLRSEVFGPDAFSMPEQLAARLQRQRRGFHAEEEPEEPRIHKLAIEIQSRVLDHVFHPRVLARLTDSRVYGGDYAVADFAAEMTEAVFDDDLEGDVSTFRQALQSEYVRRLAVVLDQTDGRDYDAVARAMALQQLHEIRDRAIAHADGNRETRAHRMYLAHLIDQALAPKPRVELPE